jgi:hypothetical protein
MKPFVLATVLVKVMGLSLAVSGISVLATGILRMLWSVVNSLHDGNQALNGMAPFSPYSMSWLIYLGVGLFLILKTKYILVNILKIREGD